MRDVKLEADYREDTEDDLGPAFGVVNALAGVTLLALLGGCVWLALAIF